MNIFERVKDEIPPEQAAVMYGLPVRKNKARCCFHEERTPSMVFRGKTFHCFGCGAHGSTIDLCMRLFGLSPRDAALKLAKDFNIPVDTEYHAGNNPRRMRLNITKEELSLLGIREGRPFEIQVNVEDNGDPVYETFFPPTLAQVHAARLYCVLGMGCVYEADDHFSEVGDMGHHIQIRKNRTKRTKEEDCIESGAARRLFFAELRVRHVIYIKII